MTKLSMSEEEVFKRKYTRPYEKRIKELEAQVDKMKAVLQKVYDADCEVYPIRCAVAECLGIKEI